MVEPESTVTSTAFIVTPVLDALFRARELLLVTVRTPVLPVELERLRVQFPPIDDSLVLLFIVSLPRVRFVQLLPIVKTAPDISESVLFKVELAPILMVPPVAVRTLVILKLLPAVRVPPDIETA